MKKQDTATKRDVLQYLTPSDRSVKGIHVGIVWGEGNQKSPYDRCSYHAGQLSMLCAAIALLEKGADVTVFLTSDHQARISKGVFAQFYEQRQKELIEWMDVVSDHGIKVVDVPTVYDRLGSDKTIQRIWEDAGNYFKKICKELEVISNPERDALKQWALQLRAARIEDDGAKWSLAFTHPRGAAATCRHLRKCFSNVNYDEKDQDLAATAYVVSRVLLEGGKKWVPSVLRDWIKECGTVLSRDLENGVLVESARNMYWLRCLRLLGNYGAQKLGGLKFPELIRFRNLPGRHGSGAMKSEDSSSLVPIFATSYEIHQALLDTKGEWLCDFATRLSWAANKQAIVKQLARLIKTHGPASLEDNTLRNGIMASIGALTNLNHRGHADGVRIDDWYCCRYLAEEFVQISPQVMWKHNVTAAHVMDACHDIDCYETLSNRVLNKIESQLIAPHEKHYAEAVRKTVKWAGSIDLVSHMTTKRYRDHGRHQLNVAALIDLLWMASAPTEDYTYAVPVAEAVAQKDGPWKDSAESLRGMSMLAALAHDHGYALLQVAWLLGRLYTMKENDNPDARPLASSLKQYIGHFASSWFKEICDRIASNKEDPCCYISPDKWEGVYRGRLSMLVPEHSQHHWPGHGLISAMNLWGLMDDLSKSTVELTDSPKVLDALRAIAWHDDSSVKLHLDDGRGLQPGESPNPVAFMLAVSDEIQEWNRRMFWDGKTVVESPYIELHTTRGASRYSLQLDGKELKVKFVHKGIAATGVEWEYALFRSGKRRNLDRVFSSGLMFPRKVTFQTVIGP